MLFLYANPFRRCCLVCIGIALKRDDLYHCQNSSRDARSELRIVICTVAALYSTARSGFLLVVVAWRHQRRANAKKKSPLAAPCMRKRGYVKVYKLHEICLHCSAHLLSIFSFFSNIYHKESYSMEDLDF